MRGLAGKTDSGPPELSRKWKIFDVATATTDTQLEDWGRKYIRGFQAVLPRVEFPAEPLKPGHSWVLNLDTGLYSHGGTHWVGVRVSDRKPVLLYFDSFGMPPPRELVKHAWRHGRGVVRSDVRYQGYGENNCGPRSLAALYSLAVAPNDVLAFAEMAEAG